MFKKLLAFILSIVLIFSMFGTLTVTAYSDYWDVNYAFYEAREAFEFIPDVHDDFVSGGCPMSDLDEVINMYKTAAAEFTKLYNQLHSSEKQDFAWACDCIRLYDKIISDLFKFIPSYKAFGKMDYYYYKLPYNIAYYTEFECYYAQLYITLYDEQKSALTVLEWKLFTAVYPHHDSDKIATIKKAATKKVPDSIKDFIDKAENFIELKREFFEYFYACIMMDSSDKKYASLYAELLTAKNSFFASVNEIKDAYAVLPANAKESEYAYWILDDIETYEYFCNNLESSISLLKAFVNKLEVYAEASWLFEDMFYDLIYGYLSQSQYNALYKKILIVKDDLLVAINEMLAAVDALPEFFIDYFGLVYIIREARIYKKVCINLDIYLQSFSKFMDIWMFNETLPHYNGEMFDDYIYVFEYFKQRDFLNMTQLLMRFDMLTKEEQNACMPESAIAQLKEYDRGDINSDGKINGMDLMLLKKHILGVQGGTFAGNAAIQADLNFDGNINALDLLAMKKRILGVLSPIVYYDWYSEFSIENNNKNLLAKIFEHSDREKPPILNLIKTK